MKLSHDYNFHFSYFRNVNSYLQKYGFQSPKITKLPNENLGIIVVIPCFNEPNTISTLNSLLRCDKPNSNFMVILVVNQSEITTKAIQERNQQTLVELNDWKRKHPAFPLEVLEELSLPKKHAGVGLARKIGMDEAVNLFHLSQTDGIIVALDSDCEVEQNYFKAIESHFSKHPNSSGCSIRYAHPMDESDSAINLGIIQYELHLRYYNQALKFAGFPFAFHTVGSSMAVRSSAYQKQGGMNKRKAGEDFYFLQKIIELGGFTELNSTCVIPSPRISDRVPFGTGKAVGDFVENERQTYLTYQWPIFKLLSVIPERINSLYEGEKQEFENEAMATFLVSIDFENKIDEIKKNTSSFAKFEKRFYSYFNAFTVLKFTHYMRDNGFPNQPVVQEATSLLEAMNREKSGESLVELLVYYRKLEQQE